MSEPILLGFEIGTGKEVYMDLAHTVVTGMSQLSGKTTTLQAIIDRSGLRAIAFKTKRGEAGFNNYHEILPYFVERSDWQYVSGILEAYLRERVKFERSWIMKAAKNTKSLAEVLDNVKRLKVKAHGLNENVYSMLEEYLEEILPQINRFTFSKSLDLENGINVMDLSEMSLEMRLLVIRSVMENVIDNMSEVIVIIPEAWEAIPQGRATPVKLYAEIFIRKGAAIGNYLFIDSQDIAGIDKTPLRQCNNWIMGRQRETHEVDRVREVIGKKVSEEDIKTLKIGHFIAAIGDDLWKVYVLPTGVPEEMGRRVALGELTVDQVRDWIKDHSQQGDGDEEMFRQRCELLEQQMEKVKADADRRVAEAEARQDTTELEETLDFAAKGLEVKNEVIDNQREDLDEAEGRLSDISHTIVAFRDLLGIPVPSTEPKAPIPTLPQRDRVPRRRPSAGGTGFPWLEMWLDKLHNPMQEKILRMMAEKFPLELTKSDIALATGYSSKGGSFSSSLSKLVKWKLLEKRGDSYKLAQGPPG